MSSADDEVVHGTKIHGKRINSSVGVGSEKDGVSIVEMG